jgi:subtilisin family serine protease
MLARFAVLAFLLAALFAAALPSGAAAAVSGDARPVIACVQMGGEAGQARAADQAEAAQRAQERMLAALAPLAVSINREYIYLPCLAFDATPESLASFQSAVADVSIANDTLTFQNLAESTATIGSPAAWSNGMTGAGQTIAILDTGVDASHPFLAGKVVAQACFSNANGRGAGRSLCPAGAGSSSAAGAGLNCQIEGCSHGTHVAGIAAGHATGSVSFSGVAPDATLIAVQVFTRFDTNCSSAPAPCVAAYTSDQLAALEYVYGLRSQFSIAAVNMSLGGSVYTGTCDSDARKSAIDLLRSVNIATVVSAGNQGSGTGLSAPACISSAISVGSTGDGGYNSPSDKISMFSNSAPFLRLLAPGQNIQSSVPGGYAVMNGTSMAAPHVAGAWALLKSQKPSATVSEVLAALASTGAPITDARNNVTTPRIQVDVAAAALIGVPRASADAPATDEGHTGAHELIFTVSLSAASQQPVSLHYLTVDGTATAGSDYAPVRGTLTIPAGATSASVTVPVQGDRTYEDDEQFTLHLSDPSGVVLENSDPAATIRNDDAVPEIVIDDTQIVGRRAKFSLHLSNPSSLPVFIDYATAGAAQDEFSTLTFAPGTTAQTLVLNADPSAFSPLQNSIMVTLLGATNATIVRDKAYARLLEDTAPPAPEQNNLLFVPVAQGF